MALTRNNGCTNFNRQGIFVWGLFGSLVFNLKAKALHSKFSSIWGTCFLWLLDSGFWFSSVFFRFRISHVRVARQQAGVTAQTPNANERTAKRTPSKRKPESNPNGTNRRLRVQKTTMLQDGKNKRLIADLQSNISKNCTLLTLRTVHTVIISGLADMICNTISQYYRCTNDWIPKKQN